MPGPSDLVINTSPVLALAAAEHLQILRDLFAKVTAPYEVVQEIEACALRTSRPPTLLPHHRHIGVRSGIAVAVLT